MSTGLCHTHVQHLCSLFPRSAKHHAQFCWQQSSGHVDTAAMTEADTPVNQTICDPCGEPPSTSFRHPSFRGRCRKRCLECASSAVQWHTSHYEKEKDGFFRMTLQGDERLVRRDWQRKFSFIAHLFLYGHSKQSLIHCRMSLKPSRCPEGRR